MARQSHAAARHLLTAEAMKDYDAYMDEYESLEDTNIDKMKDAGLWGMLGGTITPLALSLLVPGGLPVALAALAAGAGSYAGSQIGEGEWLGEGGVQGREGVTKRRLRTDVGRGLREKAKGFEGFGEEQTAAAINSALMSYVLGGGEIPGTDAWTKGGGLKGAFTRGPGSMGPWAGIKGPESAIDAFKNIKGQLADRFTNVTELADPSFDYPSLRPFIDKTGTVVPVGTKGAMQVPYSDTLSMKAYDTLVNQRQSGYVDIADPWL